MTTHESWIDRLKQCMKKQQLSQETLAHKLGISQSAISRYFIGDRTPPKKRFKAIARVLNVDPLWLELGYNPLPRPTSVGERVQYARQQLNLSRQALAERLGIDVGALVDIENDREHFEDVEQLAATLHVTINWLLHGASPAGGMPALPNLSLAPQLSGWVPLIGWTSAGKWKEALQNLPEDCDMIPVKKLVNQNCYALRVEGDSMVNPVQGALSFLPNAIIVVDPERTVNLGSFVIAYNQSKNESVFKQYVRDDGVDYLKPLNPQYKMIRMNHDYIFLGVVIECYFTVG